MSATVYPLSEPGSLRSGCLERGREGGTEVRLIRD